MTSQSTDRPDQHHHQPDHQPDRPPKGQPDHRSERPGKDRAQLATMTVRELLAALGKVEEELRDTPFLLPRDGIMVVNPRLAPLLSRQRTLAAQLRSRRVSWNRVDATAPRQPSAAWPPPPWV
jgi:hypothetical protein